jgi:uncharacterized protein YdeI (YjbR/CyaY-like superfamily)
MPDDTTRSARSRRSVPARSSGGAAGRPRFFATPERFRAWLERNHQRATELWVGFHKRDTGKPSLTWPQSVDEALCFGWIDGIRKSLGETSYVIRFTPRRPSSRWSDVNTRRITELSAQGRVRPAGVAAFERRDPARSASYSYEQRQSSKLDRSHQRRFRANREAWAWFAAQPPWYRRVASFYVVSAKREETRARRLAILIECSARGERIGLLKRPPSPSIP